MVHGSGTYQACGQTIGRLPAGAYTPTSDCYGNIRFQCRDLRVDNLTDFPGSLASQILGEIEHFWEIGERFHRFGFLHRRGYLFYGKQGSGKSSVIHQVIARIVERGHLAFFGENPALFVMALEIFRKVEPDRPIVCVFEDIDAIIKTYGDTHLLQWLDGNHQVDQAINLASTNYPERLDRRIIARPRRFDRIIRIDSPEAPLRAAYFAGKMPQMPTAERERWVELSEGLPFAALAELVISVQCLGNDLEETAELLRSLDANEPSSQEFSTNGVAEEEG
jgi:hypothetical protein